MINKKELEELDKYKPKEVVWRFSPEGFKAFDKAVKEYIKNKQ